MMHSEKDCRGFTLIELLVATTMLALVLGAAYSAFNGGMAAWEKGRARSELFQNGRYCLTRIADDLRAAAMVADAEGIKFMGLDDEADGGMPADRISFLSYFSGSRTGESVVSDVREIGYFIETENEGESYVLRRRFDETLDEDLGGGGYSSPLCSQVKGLNFEYFNGVSWVESWDTAETIVFVPEAVKVLLWVTDSDQSETPRVFKTTVYLQTSWLTPEEEAREGGTEG